MCLCSTPSLELPSLSLPNNFSSRLLNPTRTALNRCPQLSTRCTPQSYHYPRKNSRQPSCCPPTSSFPLLSTPSHTHCRNRGHLHPAPFIDIQGGSTEAPTPETTTLPITPESKSNAQVRLAAHDLTPYWHPANRYWCANSPNCAAIAHCKIINTYLAAESSPVGHPTDFFPPGGGEMVSLAVWPNGESTWVSCKTSEKSELPPRGREGNYSYVVGDGETMAVRALGDGVESNKSGSGEEARGRWAE